PTAPLHDALPIYDRTFPRLFSRHTHKRFQARPSRKTFLAYAPLLLQRREQHVELRNERRERHILEATEVEPQHGMLPPFALQPFDRQTLEQVTATLEIRLHGGHEQGLAEAPRAREEHVLAAQVRQVVHVTGLVGIEEASLADLLEHLPPHRILSYRLCHTRL